MNSPFSLKKLIIAVTVLFMVQAASAQSADEKLQSTPHSAHAGIGYSYIPGVYVEDMSMTVGSVKSGIGIDAGYEYQFSKKLWSVGLNYTLHYASGMANNKNLIQPGGAPIDYFVHNITPTIGKSWEWEKHIIKATLGVGYMYSVAYGSYEIGEPNKRYQDKEDGLSYYFALGYEYRITPDTGLFVKLHDMEHYEEYDSDDKEWEGIVGYGISLGFNFHF